MRSKNREAWVGWVVFLWEVVVIREEAFSGRATATAPFGRMAFPGQANVKYAGKYCRPVVTSCKS